MHKTCIKSPKTPYLMEGPFPSHYRKEVAITATKEAILQDMEDLRCEDFTLNAYNELRNANLFHLVFAGELVYVKEKKCWYYYDGKVWRPDTGSIVAMECCKQLAVTLPTYCARIADDAKRAACLKTAARWQQRRVRETILSDAKSEMAKSFAAFDSDHDLLNVQNGTLELSTRTFRAHRAQDFLTRLAPVDYVAGCHDERFNRFIAEIMCDNHGLCGYLQRCFGYALSGHPREECLFLLYGATTRNGKSTLTESVMNVLGDYAAAVSPDSLAVKRVYSGAPNEDIARLKGVRLAAVSEPDSAMTFHASKVKTLTGRDTLTARYLHENSFEFRPQFRLFINTNYLPAVTDVTLFKSGRIRVIPFQRHFSEAEQDKSLKDYFARDEVKSAILNWLLDGYELYGLMGLEAPDEAQSAVAEYARVSDKVGRFVDERLTKAPGKYTATSVLYEAYRTWSNENGEEPYAHKNFVMRLKQFGMVKRKRIGELNVHCLMGYGLRSDCSNAK